MMATLHWSKIGKCYVVTFGNKKKDFFGGIDNVMMNASIWIQGGCK